MPGVQQGSNSLIFTTRLGLESRVSQDVGRRPAAMRGEDACPVCANWLARHLAGSACTHCPCGARLAWRGSYSFFGLVWRHVGISHSQESPPPTSGEDSKVVPIMPTSWHSHPCVPLPRSVDRPRDLLLAIAFSQWKRTKVMTWCFHDYIL